MATLQELIAKYPARDQQYSPDVYLKKLWGLLPTNPYVDRVGYTVHPEITKAVWDTLTPQEQQTAQQKAPDLARFGIGGFAEMTAGTSAGAKLTEQLQTPFTQAERNRDAVSLGGTSPTITPTILSSQSVQDKHQQNLGTLAKQEQTLQGIQTQFQGLQERIQKEGVTDASGKQLAAPGAYNAQTGRFINISGSPAGQAQVDAANSVSGGETAGASKARAEAQAAQDAYISSMTNARANENDPRQVAYWMKKLEDDRAKYQKSLDDYLAETKTTRAAVLSKMTPSAREAEISKQLKDLRMEAEQFQLQTEKDKLAEYEGQTLGFARGRASEIDLKASFRKQEQALKEKNLLLELGLEQEARGLELKTLEQQLSWAKDDFELRDKVQTRLDDEEDEIFTKAQTLSTNAKSTLASILTHLKGIDPAKISENVKKNLNDLLAQINEPGLDYALVEAGLGNDYKRQVFEDSLKLAQEARLGEKDKKLSILDVQRYKELYPNAGIVAGDTEAQANAKIAATNTPEAKIRNLIVAAKDNGNSYEAVIAEINKDTTITDKALAIKIADEIYGKTAEPPAEPVFGTGNFAKTPLEDELKRLQEQNTKNGFPINTGVREELAKKGYPINEIDALMHPIASGISNFVDSISNFLFK